MNHYDYLIVGAGLFGAVFAHKMTRAGKKCLVIDKRTHIGGNCYTEKVEDIIIHRYGAHIFHTSDVTVWDFVNQFTEFNNYVNSPVAIYQNELYNLPFNMNTFSQMWGIKTPREAKEIINRQIKEAEKSIIEKGSLDSPHNLEEQALLLVGADIYKKLIKGYTEKQWGCDCKDLPAFIIRRLPLRFTFDNNYFNDRYQGIPIDGYTPMIEKMLVGSDVMLTTDFFELRKCEGVYTKRADSSTTAIPMKFIADKIVYTGPLDAFFDYKFGNLEYRSLRFETETLDEENYQGNAVVNYTSREVPYTRIIEHKHFVFGTQPKTVISREYPEPYTDNSEPYYPVNDDKNNALAELYHQMGKERKDIIFGGRLGSYQYYDMDQVIAIALQTAAKELSDHAH